MTYLEHYYPGPLERSIIDFYRKDGICKVDHIDLMRFAEEAKVFVQRAPETSSHQLISGDRYMIIVDSRLSWQHQRIALALHLGHILLRSDLQALRSIPISAHEEWQADQFALYALVPTYLLADYLSPLPNNRPAWVERVSKAFDVPYGFMEDRLTLLDQRMRSLAFDRCDTSATLGTFAGPVYTYRHPVNCHIEYIVRDGQVTGRRHIAEA